LNKQVVLERLQEMKENLAILEKLKRIPHDEFVKTPEMYKLAERCLQISIECILDISHYLIAQKDLPRAEGKEAILTLGRLDVLPDDFAQAISGMAGFRNILIHEYLKIDREKVYQKTQRVDDFYRFQKLILKFLG